MYDYLRIVRPCGERDSSIAQELQKRVRWIFFDAVEKP